MKKACVVGILIAPVLAIGCVAPQHYQHRPTPSLAEAQQIIEQVIMEQPRDWRPESVVFTDRYFEVRRGVSIRGKSGGIGIPIGNGVVIAGGNRNSTSREMVDRFYYDSIGETELWSRKSYWYAEIRDRDGRNPVRIYITNRAKAERFVDAMYSVRSTE